MTVLREAGITACPRCAAIHAQRRQLLPQLRAVDGPPRRPARRGHRRRGRHAAPPSQAQAPSPAAPAPTGEWRGRRGDDELPTAPASPHSGGRSGAPPATAAHPPVAAEPPYAAPAGRSPLPPHNASPVPAASAPARPGGDEATEIIRPAAYGAVSSAPAAPAGEGGGVPAPAPPPIPPSKPVRCAALRCTPSRTGA